MLAAAKLLISTPVNNAFRCEQDLEDIAQIREEVEASRLILSFVSSGYFESRSCQHEVSADVLEYGARRAWVRNSTGFAVESIKSVLVVTAELRLWTAGICDRIRHTGQSVA